MTDAAVARSDVHLDRAGGGSSVRLDAAQLSSQYGMKLAGARPHLVDYTRQVWAYRHFTTSFAEAKHVAAFSMARLGSLWSVLTPLVNAAVYLLVFGLLLNTRHGIHNFVAYLCIGVFFFGYTSKVVSTAVGSISENLNLVRALHFPRASLPLAAVLAELRQMVATVVVLLVIVAATGEVPRLSWLLLLPALLLQSLFNTGLAFTVARLGARSSDLKQLIPWVLRTWMYASGVFYSPAVFIDSLPTTLARVLQANPLLVYLELIRHALIGTSEGSLPAMTLWILAAAWAVVIGVAGYIFFWRGEQEYGRG